MAVLAVSGLGYGSLSGRFGRRPVMLWGIVLFVVGTAAAAVAPSIEFLIASRVVQAIGGGAGMAPPLLSHSC